MPIYHSIFVSKSTYFIRGYNIDVISTFFCKILANPCVGGILLNLGGGISVNFLIFNKISHHCIVLLKLFLQTYRNIYIVNLNAKEFLIFRFKIIILTRKIRNLSFFQSMAILSG